MTNQQVRAILPHRFPISMVDRVVSIQDGKFLHATKNITRNEPCFNGADAHMIYYPRSLILESFLQAGGILCYQGWSHTNNMENCAMLFGGLVGLTWYKDVPAGSMLNHYAQMVSLFDTAAVYCGEIKVDEETIATIDQVSVAIRLVNQDSVNEAANA